MAGVPISGINAPTPVTGNPIIATPGGNGDTAGGGPTQADILAGQTGTGPTPTNATPDDVQPKPTDVSIDGGLGLGAKPTQTAPGTTPGTQPTTTTTPGGPTQTPVGQTPTGPSPFDNVGLPPSSNTGGFKPYNHGQSLNFSSALIASFSSSSTLNSTTEAFKHAESSSRENKRAAEKAHLKHVATQNEVEQLSLANRAVQRSVQSSAAFQAQARAQTFNTIPSALLAQVLRDGTRQSPSYAPGEGAARAFTALRDTRTLVLPTEMRPGTVNSQTNSTFMAMFTPDEGATLVNNTLQALISRQLSPQDILQAFALMQRQSLGMEWFALGSRALAQWMSLANMDTRGALANVLAEHLAQALASRAGLLDGQNAQRAFLLTQLASIANDPDMLARLFAGIGDAKGRALFMQELAAHGKGFAGAGNTVADDAFASLLLSVGARDGSSRAPSANANFDQLRGEMLQFMGRQDASFYATGDTQTRQFHTQRMEGVLQCIIQHLMRDFSRSQLLAPHLRKRYANSIDLLSSLLELLEQESDDDAEHEREANDYEADEQEGQLESADNDDNWEAALRVRYMFRVVAPEAETASARVTWEQRGDDIRLELPQYFDSHSPFTRELEALHEACGQEQFFSTPHRPPAVGVDLLREVIQGSDGAYALGAAAVGETLLARQWTCKMWANDLATRLDARGENAAKFPFANTYRHLRANAGSVQANALEKTSPRKVSDMRLDMLRMLSNSADDWARKLANDLLEKHLKARAEQPKAGSADTGVAPVAHLAKPRYESGEVKELIQVPDMRNAAIYFLAQYYFRLEQRESVAATAFAD